MSWSVSHVRATKATSFSQRTKSKRQFSLRARRPAAEQTDRERRRWLAPFLAPDTQPPTEPCRKCCEFVIPARSFFHDYKPAKIASRVSPVRKCQGGDSNP